ncbi:dickkopf-related protein 4 isoform X1 [Rhineura floridana]|nr:dickkopf-related protein 4 isoform X1 [Rhineura floridana]XP_061449132.1 dickkopf-related protein 4 isoform X1 [Rhineura floridana]XP_061449133.1 dickkopf-related protein 4 isoform X1 [Rhineura floridana]XP_061449134.1 dickkopf-related protein 4 isoform X1 [Rhineura floridana]
MVPSFLLGIAYLCSPLTALILDFNAIRGSAEVSSSKKDAQCLADKDCPAGKFCHKPLEELPFCADCHGLRRRCQRNTMCCPGMLCINEVCSQTEKVTLVEEKKCDKQAGSSSKDVLQCPVSASHSLKKGNTQTPSNRAREGESCLRTSDCAPGLCCARHFWAKICKPVLAEGQVCSRRGQKDSVQGPEIFQRCDCGPGLSCQQHPTGASQRSRLRVCRKN